MVWQQKMLSSPGPDFDIKKSFQVYGGSNDKD